MPEPELRLHLKGASSPCSRQRRENDKHTKRYVFVMYVTARSCQLAVPSRRVDIRVDRDENAGYPRSRTSSHRIQTGGAATSGWFAQCLVPPTELAGARVGLRVGELLGLQWRDFTKEEKGKLVLKVERPWLKSGYCGRRRRGRAGRTIPLADETREELTALSMRSPGAERFSPAPDDHPPGLKMEDCRTPFSRVPPFWFGLF